jgi:probable HAF family extracellular repeat protein
MSAHKLSATIRIGARTLTCVGPHTLAATNGKQEWRSIMKTILASIAASSLLATLAIAQPAPRYTVTDLGAVGNTLNGDQYVITNNGLVSGSAAISSTIVHAVLWYKGLKFDIGTRGLGGPNSAAFGVNEWGQAVGQAETSVRNTEDFCGLNAYGLPSSTACLPFLWQYGVMTPLPTLGGANGAANMINNRGEVAGVAETTSPDPNPACPVSQFKPVIWENGKIQPLPTVDGDPDGAAIDINDNGQVVGISGPCAPFNPPLGYHLVDAHALLWEKDGSVHDLGNLGGPAGTFGGNHACAINNQGQVVGHSDLTGDTTFHAYLWTKETGMKDIGTLKGDFASAALGINDGSQVVGISLDENFNETAFLRENGQMTDLNTLIPAGSPLFLIEASKINSSGGIIGLALLKSACAVANPPAWLANQAACPVVHAFVATPR